MIHFSQRRPSDLCQCIELTVAHSLPSRMNALVVYLGVLLSVAVVVFGVRVKVGRGSACKSQFAESL